MTILTDESEIRKVREAGKIIREIFGWIKGRIREGVTTLELDSEVEDAIRRCGAEPAFKGYKGYPAAICASVNNVVVHGIPSDRTVLKNGDIVSIDIGTKKNGYYADGARTFAVGEISETASKVIRVTEESLLAGIKEAVPGNRISDISNAIESVVRRNGFFEVRAFVGHGIGKNLHESPEIPNWGKKGKGPEIKEGLLLAIEPMVNVGTSDVEVLKDGWTAVTKDGSLSGHFEHTIIVKKNGAEALT